MKKEVSIELQSVTTGYRSKASTHVVAKDIDAKIYRGELTCLIGANGAGKSTLLHTIAGFIRKISGNIIIEGKHIEQHTYNSLARKLSVVLTEKCNLKNMTIEEMIAIGRSPYTGFWGIIKQGDKHIIERSIRLVGIEHLKGRMIHTLSDGERQKVMIAKALAQETQIIFLDEPTAFLDYPSKIEVMQLLSRLSKEEGKAVFMSTHDLELSLQIADKVWLLKRDQPLIVGTPEDLALNGSLEQFFDSKGMFFDNNSGTYKVEAKCLYKAKITGEGKAYYMLRKALIRHGVESTDSADESLHIHAEEISERERKYKFIVSFGKQHEEVVTSIEQLIEEISKYINPQN